MDKNKQILSEAINKAVREALNEKFSKQDTLDMLIESVVDNNLNLLLEKGNDTMARRMKANKNIYKTDKKVKDSKRKIVLAWLRSDAVNTAEIRRKLEGEAADQNAEDAARSYFMKKVNQSHGKRFNDDEINALYAIKSSLGQ
jgi:Arc/MetJ-type ribon-helix-helix transcriptional regulator